MSEQNGEIFTFPQWDLWSQRILIYRVVLFIDGYQYLTGRRICHLRFDRELSVVVRRGRWWYPLRKCQVSSPREMRFLTPVSQVNWWNAPTPLLVYHFAWKYFPDTLKQLLVTVSCSMLEVFSSTDYLKQFLVYNYPNEQKGVSFWRNYGAASVGEYNRVINYYKLCWLRKLAPFKI